MSIKIKNIHFSYGDIKALNGVDMSVPGGAVGLLGPNGAGKSTLIRILLGFLPLSNGEGRIFDLDIKSEQNKIRKKIGYMPENDCLIPGMDAVSFTSYLGELSGMPRQEAMKRAHEVLYYVGLEESRYRLLDTYSSGMKQRLKLAQAIVHDPQLVFLDEPTSGLDPQGRKEILELISDISSQKKIQVMMSSHILSDIEQTCNYVVILNKGLIAAQGEINTLKGASFNQYEIKIKGDVQLFQEKLKKINAKVENSAEGLMKVYIPPSENPSYIFEIAVQNNLQIRHFVKSQNSLEDLFANAVGVE